jgi:hypothetical protein
MWNKTSCGCSKNAIGSVNSAAQNNSANSASVRVKRPRRHADTRCNGWQNVRDRLEKAGVLAENTVINKMTTTRTRGIAKILCYDCVRFVVLSTTQRTTHQLFEPLLTVEKQQVRSGQSELKILVSVVRFRPGPPNKSRSCSVATAFSFLRLAK